VFDATKPERHASLSRNVTFANHSIRRQFFRHSRVYRLKELKPADHADRQT
jgi:hypothetical protein